MEKVGGSRTGVEGVLSLSLSLSSLAHSLFHTPTYIYIYIYLAHSHSFPSRTRAHSSTFPSSLSLSLPPQLVTRSIRGLHLLLLFTSTFVNHLAPAFAGPFISPEATYIPSDATIIVSSGVDRNAWPPRIHNSLRRRSKGSRVDRWFFVSGKCLPLPPLRGENSFASMLV